MPLRNAFAGAGLLLAISAMPVAGFAMLVPAPAPDLSGVVGSPGVAPIPAPSTPGYGDFGGPGNPYGPDASPMGVHWGGGAFSDQQPLNDS